MNQPLKRVQQGTTVTMAFRQYNVRISKQGAQKNSEIRTSAPFHTSNRTSTVTGRDNFNLCNI